MYHLNGIFDRESAILQGVMEFPTLMGSDTRAMFFVVDVTRGYRSNDTYQ